MFKLIYEILINPLGLPIETGLEYLIIFAIGEVSHELAYWLSPGGKDFGSFAYWASKLVVFVVIWALLYVIILAIQFIVSNWIWFLIGGVSLILIGFTVIILYKKKKNSKGKNNEKECN